MIDYPNYEPRLWKLEELIIPVVRSIDPTKKERVRKTWKMMVGAGLLAATSTIASAPYAFGANLTSAVSSNLLAEGLGAYHSTNKHRHVVLSPIRNINRSFNTLIDSIRSGKSLIPSEAIRQLADQAAGLRHAKVDVEAWAAALANDIKDAHD